MSRIAKQDGKYLIFYTFENGYSFKKWIHSTKKAMIVSTKSQYVYLNDKISPGVWLSEYMLIFFTRF